MRRMDELQLEDLAATEALGRRLAATLRPGDSVLLEGPLGAGKTALARAVLRALCRAPALEVPSPSYTLVQSYEALGFTVSHFDLWRLQGDAGTAARDVAELGWDEAREGVVLVEWPDRLGALTPHDALTLTLRLAAERPGLRLASLSGWARRREWLPEAARR